MPSALDRMTRTLGPASLAIAVAAGTLAPGAAAARGYVSFGFGFYPPPPVVYAPPPVYYVPPPPVVYPPPPYYVAPTTYAPVALPPAPAAAAPAAQECREYQSTAVIDGQPQQTVGTACRQPDGTWRIVK